MRNIYDFNKILEYYEIQDYEEKSRKDGKINLFIDTSDVLNIIGGLAQDANKRHFSSKNNKSSEEIFDSFFKEPELFAHALIYLGWLDNLKLKMLIPHEVEYIHVFKTSCEGYEHSTDTKEITHFLSNFNKETDDLNAHKYESYLSILNLFISCYLSQPPSPIERFKTFHQTRLKISKETYNPAKYLNHIYFKKIKDIFDDIRPNPNQEMSNYVDTFSLIMLHEKLELYNNNNNNNLPIFYSSASSFRKVVERFRRKHSPNFLKYPIKKGKKKYISILRNSVYFLIDFIFNPANINISEKLIKSINDFKSDLALEHKNTAVLEKIGLESTTSEFSKNIYKILTEFLVKEMLTSEREKFHTLSVNALKEYDKNFSEENLKKKYTEIKKLLEESSFKVEKIQLFRKIAKHVLEILNDKALLSQYKSKREDFSVFRDFGMTRFSFPRNLGDDIQKATNQIIDVTSDKHHIKYQVISYLSGGIYNADINKLLKGFAILFIFEKYDAIISICNELANDLNYLKSYRIAVLHSVSLSFRSGASYYHSIDILEKIEHHLESIEDKSYKVWISMSYAYFQVWNKIVNVTTIPEMHLKFNSLNNRKTEDASRCLEKSTNYLVNAINWLEKHKEEVEYEVKDEKEEEIIIKSRTRKYYYCLNMYLYYNTKGLTKEEFLLKKKALSIIQFRLLEGTSFKSGWQMRFYDTLGWFSFRKAVTASNEEDFKKHLKKAKEYNELASQDIYKSVREKKIYICLENAIGLIGELDKFSDLQKFIRQMKLPFTR